MRETASSVTTAMGAMRAIVHYPDADGPLPGVVLVDGAGDSVADGWGAQPATFGGCGAVVLTHDKPGCGGSPGDWRDQSLADRASDSLAALEILRDQPGVDPGRVGFLGISQGGWVSAVASLSSTSCCPATPGMPLPSSPMSTTACCPSHLTRPSRTQRSSRQASWPCSPSGLPADDEPAHPAAQ